MRCCNRRNNVASARVMGAIVNTVDNTNKECIPVAVVPIVLAELTAQIDLHAVVTLGNNATNIDQIEKNVVVTQTRLVAGTNRLFITGYLNEDIEYFTPGGNVRHTLARIPFSVVTPIDFDHCRRPKLCYGEDSKEAFYNTCGICRTTRDLTRTDRFDQELFNNPVYTEVLSANIFEADVRQISQDLTTNTTIFNQISQDIVIYLTIRLLQDQAVGQRHNDERDRDEDDFDNFVDNNENIE